MNRGELRELVWYWLNDPDGGYYTETQVNTWLNNALIECQKQLLDCGEYWYTTCAKTNFVQNEACYALPSNFLKANRLEIRVQGSSAPNEVWTSIDPATLNEGAAVNFGNGQPMSVTIVRDCLLVRPIPDTTYLVRLYYSYKVAPMVDDLNVPDVPLQYQEYIALLAARDGYSKDASEPSSEFKEKFRDYKEMMKKDQIQRNRSQPRRVVRTMGDGNLGGGTSGGYGW